MELWDFYGEKGKRQHETWDRANRDGIPEGESNIVCDVMILMEMKEQNL